MVGAGYGARDDAEGGHGVGGDGGGGGEEIAGDDGGHAAFCMPTSMLMVRRLAMEKRAALPMR